MSLNKKIINTVSTLLTVGVLYFAFVYGKHLLNEVNLSSIEFNYWLLTLSFILFGVFYLLIAWHWQRVCRSVNKQANVEHQNLAFFASQPYKYLPSSVFTFSFRAKFAKDLGMSVKQSSLAQLIENFNILGAGLVTSVIFYLASVSVYAGIGVSAVVALVFGVVIRNKSVAIIPKLKRRVALDELSKNFVLIIGAWVVSGISFWVLSASVGVALNPTIAISANAVAYVASILAVFAPGGIGVRELVLALFSVSNGVIIFWRILTFIADMVFGFAAILLLKKVTAIEKK